MKFNQAQATTEKRMPRSDEMVTTAQQVLGVDVLTNGMLEVRYRSSANEETSFRITPAEAHGLVDMMAIALRRLPSEGKCTN